MNDATGVEKRHKASRTLTAGIMRIGAVTILGTVEDSIEITYYKSGDRGIVPVRNVLQELVSIGVAVRGIYTANTE